MSLSTRPVIDLLASFRSSEPTPGGGSASALSGAVGAALLAMTAGLPKPRIRTEVEREQLAASGARCAAVSDRLAALMDRDSDSYDLVLAAFRLPKASDDERAARSARIQEALKAATEAPLDVMRACAAALHEAGIVAAFGNANASSDVGVGLELLGAGLRGARLNVEVNLASVKDQAYVAAVRAEVQRLAADAIHSDAAAHTQLERSE